MYLDEFFDYKNRLMPILLSNKKIVSLLTDEEHPKTPYHSGAYNFVYPFEYLPDTVDEGKTFICYDVDIADVENKTFLKPVLYIWVFTHKSKLRLREGGLRLDNLCAEIDKELNGNRFFGLGELELKSVGRFIPTTDFRGRVMAYTARDFNRFTPSGKPVPSNRKRGK